MLSASAGIFFIDYIIRPFFKIGEKMPWLMLLFVMALYGSIGYMVLKSVYFAEQQH